MSSLSISLPLVQDEDTLDATDNIYLLYQDVMVIEQGSKVEISTLYM